MRFVNIRYVLVLIIWLIVFWSFLTPNMIPNEFNLIVHLNIFLHASVCVISLKYFLTQKIPFIFLISFFNAINYGYVLLEIPAEEFQLSTFNYSVLEDLFLGFILFYFVYFFLVEYNLVFNRNNKETQVEEKSSYLKIILLLLFASSYIIEFPISGMNQVFQFFSLGIYFIGFITKKNKVIDNILFFSILTILALEQIVSGMIFAIVYLGIYIFALYLIYGIKSFRATFFITVSIISILLFSQLFSAVKFDYRELVNEDESTFKKVELINDLIETKQDDDKVKKEVVYQETTLWRLSYQLSALSFVYEKTPSLVPYWEGSTYLSIFVKFIPRFIWPDKPIENMGQKFGHTYKILRDEDTRTSMNTPIVAEAYMNFGFIGILFILSIFAMLIASLSRGKNDKSNNSNILDSIVLAQLSVILIQSESNFSMMVGKIIILFFMRYILKQFVFLKGNLNFKRA